MSMEWDGRWFLIMASFMTSSHQVTLYSVNERMMFVTRDIWRFKLEVILMIGRYFMFCLISFQIWPWHETFVQVTSERCTPQLYNSQERLSTFTKWTLFCWQFWASHGVRFCQMNRSSILNRWSKETKGTFLGFAEGRYYGYFIGAITDNVASVGGDVFAVDKTSVIITNFTHDGTDPGKQKYYNKERKNSNTCRNFYLCWNFKSWWVLHQDWISSYKSSGNVSVNNSISKKNLLSSAVCSKSLFLLLF